jgi:hypothetical protein
LINSIDYNAKLFFMENQLVNDPNAKRIVQFCAFLGDISAIGHKRADRLQSVLFNPHNKVLFNRIGEVLKAFVPSSAKITSFVKLGESLKKYHHSAPDHTYQATLRRWLDGKPKAL